MLRLKQTVDLTSLDVNVDIEVSRRSGETGDGLNVGRQCISITRCQHILGR